MQGLAAKNMRPGIFRMEVRLICRGAVYNAVFARVGAFWTLVRLMHVSRLSADGRRPASGT